MKLWQKEHTRTSEMIEAFTVGRDREFDLELAKYDVQGSMAHVTMLAHVGLLPEADLVAITQELNNILGEIEKGEFVLNPDVEDIHSQIELMLTGRIGEAGKKIHSGRSRNDQVAVDIKLYLRAQLLEVRDMTVALFHQLQALSEQHKDKLLPGYTHLQLAMPSSFGLWFGAYAESLVDDMALLSTAYHMANKNPLGSGAGYGSSFPLDREMTTRLLHFSSLHYNSVYAQMSRGKTERFAGVAIAGIAAALSRFSMDVCLYMNQNFGFVTFPAELTTGSSIMPHKKNPDVFELIRGKCNRIQSVPNELALLITNLPSGYHREMQLTKEILFPAIEDLKKCLQIAHMMLEHIVVKDHLLDNEQYKYLFTVEQVNDLVNQGIPFREAYKQVGNAVEDGTFFYSKPIHHTHEGSIGNLCTAQIKALMQDVLDKWDDTTGVI